MPRTNRGPYLADDPNPSGVYEIRWTENGRSKRRSTGKSNYRDAQRVYAEFLLALDKVSAGGQVTVDDVIDAYLADRTDVMDLSSQRICFGHLRTFFGDMLVSEIDSDVARRYQEARARGDIFFVDADGRKRGGVKAGPGTVRRELGMLSTAIGHAISKKKFKDRDGRPLLAGADKPDIELPPMPAARDRWLTRKEAAAFLAACQPDPAAPLTRAYRYIAMMLYTASRKGAVEALTWDRIDLERGLINFSEPGRRQTKKRRGWVPISDEFLPIVQRAYKERTTEYYLDCTSPPYHAWRAAARRAGLVAADDTLTVSPHVLRHTWATWAAQDGVPLHQIAQVLHDTVATVERHYAHHSPDHLRVAVNRPLIAAE
jgi:integrase